MKNISNINKKLSKYSSVTDLNPSNDKSHINVYRKNYEYNMSILQTEITVDVTKMTCLQYFNALKVLDQKAKARQPVKKPGQKLSK